MDRRAGKPALRRSPRDSDRRRQNALRERERRGLRRFTIGVSEDDLRVIAESTATKAPQAPTTTCGRNPSASSSPTCSPPRSARVTALRRSQRRFSNDVTPLQRRDDFDRTHARGPRPPAPARRPRTGRPGRKRSWSLSATSASSSRLKKQAVAVATPPVTTLQSVVGCGATPPVTKHRQPRAPEPPSSPACPARSPRPAPTI